jgi:hypothetical protein
MQKKLLAFLMMSFTILNSCQSRSDDLNKKNITQIREVENFTGIKVENAINVFLTQGNKNSVSVNAISEIQENVITQVVNGILEIKLKSGNWKWNNKKVIVNVTMQSITSLQASGASDIKINDKIIGEDLKIKLSGASSLSGKIKTLVLNAALKGASSIDISGIAGNTEIEASGASSFDGFDFICEDATLKASGASEINITATKNLSATASGASSIQYKGKPNVKDLKSSGSSNIKQKN